MVLNGAGLGVLSGYLCAPGFAAVNLVRLFPAWALPSVEGNVVFPSNREPAPAVRAFVDFLKRGAAPGRGWLDATAPD